MEDNKEFVLSLIKAELSRENHSMECLSYNLSSNTVDLDLARAMLDRHWEQLVKLNSAAKWIKDQ